LPAPSADDSTSQTGGVFMTILKRKPKIRAINLSLFSKFLKRVSSRRLRARFLGLKQKRIRFRNRVGVGEIFDPAPIFDPYLKRRRMRPPRACCGGLSNPTKFRPVKRGSATGKTNPAGRLALTKDDPKVLLGQTVKGRYTIAEQIGQDEGSIFYLAEDKIVPHKKVVVRVLMDKEADDFFSSKFFVEERVSLSHISHPNIAGVIDSGELSEGVPFIVTEFAKGKTVKEELQEIGQFDALRTARIIRQASYALSEVHQSGIVHRSLKPENIVLTINENGAEQVKLTNFGASKGKVNQESLLYKSPEQIAGKFANPTSDGFSLAVIAYQMLTGRLPFDAATVGGLLKLQREGLRLRPSEARSDLPPPIDEILEKALAFNAPDRYRKVRDFGDEFFGEIAAHASFQAEEGEIAPNKPKAEKAAEAAASGAASHTPAVRETTKTAVAAPRARNSVRTINAPKMRKEMSLSRFAVPIFSAAILLAALLGVWYYLANPSGENVNQNATITNAAPEQNAASSAPATEEAAETPPLARSISPPPDSFYFQNSKAGLKGEAVKNYLGFSLYYPNDWRLNKAGNNFWDVSKNADNNVPIEQMLVSYYNSRGTYRADKEIFPALIRETNGTLSKILPNYQVVSEGKRTVNNGWQAYEIKFQGTGKTTRGEEITIWGRRLFIPAAIRGIKNGYVVTMLATSLSEDVKNVEDVGVKGELSAILETFEPNQNF
jgi:serine/threonine-protein kinase